MAQKLDIAFWSYDRTRLLTDGSVKIEGADVAFYSALAMSALCQKRT
jgi:hypothetical protein